MAKKFHGLTPNVASLVTVTVLSASAAFATDPVDQPVNCATAEGDLRVLKSERDHAEKEQLKGVTAVTPSGAVIGILTGKEDEKLEALSGDYIKQIDAKTAAIKKQCNL